MAAISSVPQPHVASNNRRRVNRLLWRTALLLLHLAGDALVVNLAFVGTYLLLFEAEFYPDVDYPSPEVAGVFLVLLNVAFLVTFVASGLYSMRRGTSRVDEAGKVFVAVSLATIGAIIIDSLLLQFAGGGIPWTPRILALAWLITFIVVTILRWIYRRLLVALRMRGIDIRRVLIAGARGPGRAVFASIRRNPEMGYRVVGFLSDSLPVGELLDGIPVLGRPAALPRVVRATHIDEVIIAVSGRTPDQVLELVALADDQSVEVKVYPDTFQLITNNGITIGDLAGLPLISVKNAALDKPWNQAMKRGLDLLVAATVLVLASPVMLLAALAIRLESPGPVFFIQERVGLDGRPFQVIKFRSMHADAERMGNWTVKDDPRRTRVGAFLRRYSIDELPQFINVLWGDMSVVGPRPEQPAYVERFRQEIPRYHRRHKEKAGITGWAQVNGLRGDTSIEERTRYDLYYVENWSLLFDLKIIVKTVFDLFNKQNNAY